MSTIFRLKIIILFMTCLPALSSAQGLKFVGMERPIEERTSYEVFVSQSPSFSNVYSISFEMLIYPESEFGYIMRIRDPEDKSLIWNMSYDGKGEDIEIRINREYKYSLIIADIKREKMRYMQWYDIVLTIDFLNDSLCLRVGDEKFYSKIEIGHKVKTVNPIITFGKSDHIIDVPSFAIRNLSVYEEYKGGKKFFFPLDADRGTIVDNSDYTIQGRVENPVWIVEESMKWMHEATMTSSSIASTGYNIKEKTFYMISKDSVRLYNADRRNYEKKKTIDQCPVDMYSATSVVSPVDSCIYVYELYNDKRTSPISVARLNRNKRWEPLSTNQMDHHMHHHAPFFLEDSNQFVFFGGFGSLLYNGDFYGLDPVSHEWKKLWNNQQGGADSGIFPRYFTSVGKSEDGRYLYVFGGMGNECGEQIVGRRYFYDLHRIDMNTGEMEKLWEVDWNEEDVVPVRNMYIHDGYMYVMCYPEYLTHSYLQLYCFSLKDGSHEIFSNKLPIFSDRINTNANMYYDKHFRKLFVTIQEFKDDISSTMKIYSLGFPPIKGVDRVTGIWVKRHRQTIVWGALLLSVLAVVIAFVTVRYRRTSILENLSGNENKRRFVPQEHVNSIQLFGDFKVIDPQGNDISNIFTSQQQMILFMLLKRYNENGMSSKRLSSILWPDKEEDKVKNSRGVAINNLRKSLSHLNGISLIFNDGRYRIEVEDGLYCDYLKILPALEGKESNLDETLLVLAKGGKFLSLVTDPVFDAFKEKVENRIIDLLHSEIEKYFDAKDYRAVVEIAEMLSVADSLDEMALRYKVSAFKRMKMNEEARMCYSKFVSEYRVLYGQDYAVEYKKI